MAHGLVPSLASSACDMPVVFAGPSVLKLPAESKDHSGCPMPVAW